MRQPLKPFSVETRQNGRRKSRAAIQAPREMFAGISPDGSKPQTSDAALRAADLLFGPAASKQPDDTFRPAALDPQTLMTAPRSAGRILQAIEEPVPDLPTPVVTVARRGRPPGSKNKVARTPSAASLKNGGAQRAEMTADDLVASLFGTGEIAEPVFVKKPAAIAMTPDDMRLRFAWIGKTLGPGERWKRRLPRICW